MGYQSSQKTRITEDMNGSSFFGFGYRSKLRDNEIMLFFFSLLEDRNEKRGEEERREVPLSLSDCFFEILSEKSISLDNYIFFPSSAFSWSPLSSKPSSP